MKKILIVADQPGWIFERHAKEIQARLSDQFVIDIAFHNHGIATLSEGYDLVYVMDPMPNMTYPPRGKTIMGLRCEFLFREHPDGAKGLYLRGFPGRCVSIRDKCCIFHVVNRYQYEVFRDMVIEDMPIFLAQHGVNESIFDMSKYPKNTKKELVASISGRGSENKGFDMVVDACNRAKIKYNIAGYGRGQLAVERMPMFYNQANIHICMSQTEGLNNPILEAGAMGLPIISTKTGAAPEIIKDGENGFLIERNVEALTEAIEKMKNPELRQSMSQKIHQEITTNWTWKERIRDFKTLFTFYFIHQSFGNGKWGEQNWGEQNETK